MEFSLTDIALSLKPVLDAMHKWGTKYMMQTGKQGAKGACRVKSSVA